VLIKVLALPLVVSEKKSAAIQSGEAVSRRAVGPGGGGFEPFGIGGVQRDGVIAELFDRRMEGIVTGLRIAGIGYPYLQGINAGGGKIVGGCKGIVISAVGTTTALVVSVTVLPPLTW
jgi:hypothetical protein